MPVILSAAKDLVVALASLLAATSALAADALLLNPFGDPFVQATSGRSCPAPLGPAYTDANRLAESHSRIERGTSCWLAGKCTEPNAYRYDAPNAKAAVAALRAEPSLAASAIWVTAQAAKAEALARATPDVDQVIPALALPGERAPYARAQP